MSGFISYFQMGFVIDSYPLKRSEDLPLWNMKRAHIMESSGKPSALLPTVLGNESVCVFHLCLPCMCSLTHGRSQLYVTHEEYSGALEVIDDSSLGNEWLTKKDIHGREQHAQQFLSFEEKKKCAKTSGEKQTSVVHVAYVSFSLYCHQCVGRRRKKEEENDKSDSYLYLK